MPTFLNWKRALVFACDRMAGDTNENGTFGWLGLGLVSGSLRVLSVAQENPATDNDDTHVPNLGNIQGDVYTNSTAI
jgi:hypothetical protein